MARDTGPTPTPRFTSPDGRAERCRAAVPELAAVFSRCLEAEHAPGLSWGLVVDGALVHSAGLGRVSLEDDRQPDADTRFRIASMTKSFTAAAVLELRDAGSLSLDEPAVRYVPELRALGYPTTDAAPVTLRDLLSMAAGWPQDDPWADRQLHRSDESMSALYAGGVSFSNPPGITFEYSNTAYMLLGRVISAACGVPAMDYIRETLLEPLGLTSTSWSEGMPAASRLAPGYRFVDDSWRAEPALANAGDVAAFAGLWSTVTDLARWVAWFLDAWPPRDEADPGPLGRASRREMQQVWRSVAPTVEWARIDETPRPRGGGYGYGLSVTHRGAWWAAGHGGGLPGYGSHMCWAPEHGIGVMALANVTYANVHDACHEALRALVEGVPLEARAVVVSEPLRRADQQVSALLQRWEDELAAAAFADNFFLDRAHAERLGELERLAAAHGRLTPEGEIEPRNWLRGRRRLRGERGAVEASFTLAPTVPALIQTLELESIPPLEAPLAEAVDSVVRAIEGDDEPLRAICTEDVWPGARTQVRIAELRHGECRFERVLKTDGRTCAQVRLGSSDGSLDVEVTLGAEGSISVLLVRPTL